MRREYGRLSRKLERHALNSHPDPLVAAKSSVDMLNKKET